MSAPDPYRDELRAARDRIAVLEEKLAAREGAGEPEEGHEHDAELERLRAYRGKVLLSMEPASRVKRAVTLGALLTLMLGAPAALIFSSQPHPDFLRIAVVALLGGVVGAAMVFFTSLSTARVGLEAADKGIAAIKARRTEARRLRAIEQELLEARQAREAQAPVRIAVAEEGAGEGEEEIGEEKRAQRAAR